MGHRAIAALAAAGMASGLWVGAAAADPKKGDTFDLVCDNGHTYTVATSTGHGNFTPAHDLNSTAVLVPVSFGPITGTVQTGDVITTFTEPGSSKGQSSNSVKNPVTCTFNFTFTSDGTDPAGPPAGSIINGTGTVVVKITPGS